MHIYSFEKLEVWKISKDFALYVYQLTSKFPADEKYGITSQMRRACISIASNIAEGGSRINKKEKSYFYTVAYSSAIELLNQSIICQGLNYLKDEDLNDIRIKIEEITRGIGGLKKSLNL